MTKLPVPTPQHPAHWETVADLAVGDVIVTKRSETGRVTALIPQRGRRTRVIVGNVVHYPHALADAPVLVLR